MPNAMKTVYQALAGNPFYIGPAGMQRFVANNGDMLEQWFTSQQQAIMQSPQAQAALGMAHAVPVTQRYGNLIHDIAGSVAGGTRQPQDRSKVPMDAFGPRQPLVAGNTAAAQTQPASAPAAAPAATLPDNSGKIPEPAPTSKWYTTGAGGMTSTAGATGGFGIGPGGTVMPRRT